ncbi:hypothetical protein BKA69DRAFT_1056708, partial [Paraphysoderma sedebokerense]
AIVYGTTKRYAGIKAVGPYSCRHPANIANHYVNADFYTNIKGDNPSSASINKLLYPLSKMKITASIRAILYLSFFLYTDITSTVIPLSSQSISQGTFTRIEHRRFPSSVAPQVARPQRSSRLNAVPSDSNGIPEDQSKFVPFVFRDVVKMSPSSVQQESCAPSPLANQLSETCPFDSNNLEDLGLEFIGWHGDVLENVDSLQEKIVISSELAVATGDAVSQPKKGRLGDGFYVRDELMVSRPFTYLTAQRAEV